MTSAHPVIVVNDPLRLDYSKLFHGVVDDIKASKDQLHSIDVFIQSQIKDSQALNLLLSTIYSKIRSILSDFGFDYTFQIDVFFNSTKFEKLRENWKVLYHLENEAINNSIPELIKVVTIPEASVLSKLHVPEKIKDSGRTFKCFDVTAVGGTFDHLHDAHKLLLSMSAFLTSKTLIVGITGPKLLTNKKFSEALESYEKRQEVVINFIQKHISSEVKFEIFQINDVCGPTGYIEEIDALILSYESSKGGAFVNKVRKEKGFPLLDTVSIKVIGSDYGNEENNWKGKLSSTDIREIEVEKLQNLQK
ncbi:hypothetical protein HYPBUDRAFT_164775 [Hyphopichia burtonii NRRL Y-1933]|uniref:Cytidyltransferase-like domain-containing protein n=1 Tax=Hyphopichia burtonii NRRL Y-1933 TaxID=984485 RepID=A0A1E4RSJ3_9ASCO|nr:hypothetical protein HYPBUDRAFT_164775 [Hyphopichia burtonii NRRL Y-1933]ODV70217.1 hypothetical protein HYPBUDRAFT_164775 [Hyphopichia burtonii NRRL Y-1933]